MFNKKRRSKVMEENKKHPKALEVHVLVVTILVSVLGVIVGLELITRLGITTNTSIIGALIAIVVARIPLRVLKGFTDIHSQNLIQTSISASTFVAGNAILLPIGVPWLLGRFDLVLPMYIGAFIAVIASITQVYWIFDTRVFPASNAWPPGIATAEAILAAAKKGKRALLLLYGGIAGAVLNGFFGIPADVLGVSWIGNIWALTMFGIGLLVRGYSPVILGVDVNKLYIPHGIMIGAGVVALIQIISIIRGKGRSNTIDSESSESMMPEKMIKFTLTRGISLYLVIAVLIVVIGRLFNEMSLGMTILWIIFAAIASLCSQFLVGLSAMHAGWFPAFAIALIVLALGMLIGFPAPALALLVGYAASVGPAFADMSYDLKAGWILRGRGIDPKFELEGRKQQYIAELVGALMAAILVFFAYEFYFAQDLFPPVDRVYVSTILAGVDPTIARNLFIWMIPGAIIQAIGGPARQLGVLFATGLLILNPIAGFTVLIGIGIRLLVLKKMGDKGQDYLYVLGAGFIAGSALVSFFTSTLKLGKPK